MSAIDKAKLAQRLGPVYSADDQRRWGITRVGLALLCDEIIDPSGELLGLIRDDHYRRSVQKT